MLSRSTGSPLFEPSGERVRAVLFDLDGTLFDHFHSLRNALLGAQLRYPALLGGRSLAELLQCNQRALDGAYDEYLAGRLPKAQVSAEKTARFFAALGIEAGALDPERFACDYQHDYRLDRRATPYSVDTLVRLREHGIQVAVLTNGSTAEQREKLRAIELAPHTDHLFASEEIGYVKPDPEAFRHALARLGREPSECVMVGDSLTVDVRGALAAGLRPVLYVPEPVEDSELPLGTSCIRRIDGLLDVVGVSIPSITPQIEHGETLHLRGLGADLITAPKPCLHLDAKAAHRLLENLAVAVEATAAGLAGYSVASLVDGLRRIAEAGRLIDASRITIGLGKQPLQPSPWQMVGHIETTPRPSSIRLEYEGELSCPPHRRASVEQVVKSAHGALHELACDHPRAALRTLRREILRLAAAEPALGPVQIAGQGLDEEPLD